MGVDWYTCANCRETYPDCGYCWTCTQGHGIGPCCLDERKEYERDEDGYITPQDCPCCVKGGTPIERAIGLLKEVSTCARHPDYDWSNDLALRVSEFLKIR